MKIIEGIFFRSPLVITWAVLLSFSPFCPARAQSLDMKDVGSLPTPDVSPQVIGGESANPANWPATLIFRNQTGGGCTATVIGPRVVLTAAHCIENGANGRVTVGKTTTDVVCNHHGDYPARISADFALCLLSAVLPRLPYEKVNMDSSLPQQATKLRLLGYGCLTQGGGDRSFGALFQGWADVVNREDLYAVTQGGAALCFGDSGGGAFAYSSPAETKRVLVAVNSRGDVSRYSWVSTTGSASFSNWARSWAANNNVTICGMHDQVEGCRD